MQIFYRYTLPAVLLVLLLSTAGFCQSTSSATIAATATVAAPVGVTSLPELNDSYPTLTPGLYILCPTESHVIVTVNDGNHTIHSPALSDASILVDSESGQPVVRMLDCSQLSLSNSADSTTVVTVIITEN